MGGLIGARPRVTCERAFVAWLEPRGLLMELSSPRCLTHALRVLCDWSPRRCMWLFCFVFLFSCGGDVFRRVHYLWSFVVYVILRFATALFIDRSVVC